MIATGITGQANFAVDDALANMQMNWHVGVSTDGGQTRNSRSEAKECL